MIVQLQQSQQDKLAARMLERARELDFSQLDITDPKGHCWAAGSGKDMVILKRQVIIAAAALRLSPRLTFDHSLLISSDLWSMLSDGSADDNARRLLNSKA